MEGYTNLSVRVAKTRTELKTPIPIGRGFLLYSGQNRVVLPEDAAIVDTGIIVVLPPNLLLWI